MRITFLLIFSLLLPFSKMAAAYTCSTPTPTLIRSIPTVTVPRDAPVGSILGAFFTPYTPFSCSNDAPSLTYQEFGVKAMGTYVMTVDNRRIYSTNVPGIGYSVYSLTSACIGGVSVSVDGTNTIGGDVNTRLLCSANGMIDPTKMSSQPGMVIYKTGPVTSGTVNATTVGAFVLRNNLSTWQSPQATFGFSAFSVQSTGCTVNNNNMSIEMGNVKKSEFSGIGSTPASTNTKNVNISLACTTGTKVSLQVDGNIQNAANGVLSISNISGAAAGVGIQILYNNAPLALNSPLLIGTAATTMTIPLQARYYQTQSTITPGIANSFATFTMTYQ